MERQVPLTEKQPPVRLMPPVVPNVEVASEKLMPPVLPRERSVPGEVVPMPTLPVDEINIEDVACATPESLPTRKFPLEREMADVGRDETVKAPPEFESPVPSRLLNDEPPMMRLVVLAVAKVE